MNMDVKNSLNHDVPDIESMCKYSDILFGTTEGTVTCDYCGFISDNVSKLKLHKATPHYVLIFQCSQCEVTDIEKDTLLNQVREAHEGKGFPCELCEYATETGHLQRHVEIKHIDGENKDYSKILKKHYFSLYSIFYFLNYRKKYGIEKKIDF